MNRAQRRSGGGGGAGGFGGINPDMLRRAQELQNKLLQAQEEAALAVTEGTSGGGVVRAQVKGDMKVIGISIEKDVVDPEDVDMLQDLILAAIKDAQDRIEAKQAETMGSLTGGLKIPGLL
ncbi:MAG TPA: YbaB/EbfC family nucleoid-associated protein [Dehalococcoidia bacterium]|jgi:DNA-binding YbaB/EbfC family protein